MKTDQEEMYGYISHYRLEEKLGEGGMGKVFLAFDERLERSVALKRLHQQKSSQEYQLRLHQESKLLAKLNHPSIVQIYDLVENGSELILVMEYISGCNLKTWLQKETPDINQVLMIAINIVEGLQVAHRVDVIHRDLKPDNVMVDNQGNVKITDFGIAKSLTKPQDLQTNDGLVIGSLGAMSPEQILGHSLDHRCDFFALGLLIFQMITGKHAFGDPKHNASFVQNTLSNQAFFDEIPNGIPEQLIDLLKQLLEKSPVARPPNAAVILAALKRISDSVSTKKDDVKTTQFHRGVNSTSGDELVLSNDKRIDYSNSKVNIISDFFSKQFTYIIFALLFFLIAGCLTIVYKNSISQGPHYIAVLPPDFNLQENEEHHALLDTAIYSAVMDGVLSLNNVALISPNEIQRYTGRPAEIGIAVGADALVTSTVYCLKVRCDVQLNYTDPVTKSVMSQRHFPIRIDQLIAMQQSLVGQTQGLLNNYSVKSKISDLSISEDTYRDYLALVEERKPREVNEFALQKLHKIQNHWPKFLPIYDLLTQYYIDAFLASKNNRYLERAQSVLEKALEMLPNTNSLLQNQVKVSLHSQYLDNILSKLALLRKQGLDEASVFALQSEYWQKRGDNQKALESIDSAIAYRKSSRLFYRKALILWVIGSTESARTALNEAIFLYPDYLQALGLLADIELIEANAEKAIKYYTKLRKLQSNSLNTNNLGLCYYLLEQFEQAKSYFLEAHTNSPSTAVFLLNLADSEWLTGNRHQAQKYYGQVLTLLAEQSSDGSEYFTIKAQALAHLKRNEEALISLKEALRINSQSVDSLYAAALVYAVIGELTSSRLHVKLAINQGISPRWFNVPWFDSLNLKPLDVNNRERFID